MRTMYDALDWTTIPHGAQLVAGYTQWPGEWADSPQGDGFAYWGSQGAILVTIASQAWKNSGVVLDVERFDATPAQAPAWVTMRRQAGVDPSVYVSSSAWGSVVDAFHVEGVVEPHYWIADWNGVANVPTGAVAHQYASVAAYDTSAVLDHWPGVDSGPITPPSRKKGKHVFLFELPNGSTYTSDLVQFRWVNGGDQLAAAQWLIASTGISSSFNQIQHWQEMGVPADQRSAQAAGAPWPAFAG